jgi:hypothetical protein
MLPLGMNCRIPESGLRGVCRELLNRGVPVTHRALRQALRERFGAAGKSARVLKVWHEEADRVAARRRDRETPVNPALPTDVVVLQERLREVERSAEVLKARAELAELREQAHQDRWGLEIDRLRRELAAQPNYARDNRNLQDTVTRLTVELQVLRGQEADRRRGESER